MKSMPRVHPDQLVLAFDSPKDWAIEALAAARRRVPCARVPKIVWANYPSTAGKAYFRENEIRLSRVLLDTHARVYDTVLHEYAHLVVFQQHGRKAKPHGPEWKLVMRQLGVEPRVTHDYPVERRSLSRQHAYRCSTCGFVLERVRPFKRNRIYSHVGCGGRFAV